MLWIVIGAGGALGSIARHGVNMLAHRLSGQSVPHATMLVNVLGCFAMGVLAGLTATGVLRIGEHARAFLFVGILGGFTTFSTFGLDTLTLVRGGAVGVALANIGVQVGLGLGAVFVGYWIGRAA